MLQLSEINKKRIIRSYISFIFSGMISLSIGSLMPFLRDSIGFSYALSGILVSMHSAGNFVASFFSGYISSKIGSKKSILIFEIFLFLGYLLIAFTNNNILLLIAFFMTGLARGAMSNFNNKAINDISKGDTFLLNLLHAMFSIGAFTFPLIVLFVTRNNQGNFIYVVYLLIIVAIVNYFLYLTYPAIKVENTNLNEKKTKKTNLLFLKEKIFYLTAFIFFFYLCAEQGTIGWLISYFKDTGFLPAKYSQLSSSLQWFMLLLGRLTVAYLSTRLNVKNIYRCMGIGFFVFCILLLVARNPILILIGIAGFGFSMAGIYPTTVSLAGDIIKKYDLAWSCMLTIGSLGSIIMPTIIGFVSNHFGILLGMSTIVIVVLIDLILILIRASKIEGK